MFIIVRIPNKIRRFSVIDHWSVLLLYNLSPTNGCARFYMQPLWHNEDLCTLTTNSVSQVLIDTWVWRFTLNSYLAQGHLYLELQSTVVYSPRHHLVLFLFSGGWQLI